jgi:hypothetical protein
MSDGGAVRSMGSAFQFVATRRSLVKLHILSTGEVDTEQLCVGIPLPRLHKGDVGAQCNDLSYAKLSRRQDGQATTIGKQDCWQLLQTGWNDATANQGPMFVLLRSGTGSVEKADHCQNDGIETFIHTGRRNSPNEVSSATAERLEGAAAFG